MKTMPKIFSALLLLVVIAYSLVSCYFASGVITGITGDTNGDIRHVVPNSESTPTADTTFPITASTSTADTTDAITTAAVDTTPTIEECVLLDYHGLVVTAKEIIMDSFSGPGITVLIENNTDKDYTVGIDQAIVNNYMVYDWFSSTVAAGKKANDTIYFSSKDIKSAGIEHIGQIELYLYVRDSTTYTRQYTTDCITIITSDYDKMEVPVEDTGYTLLESNGVKIIAKYVDEDTLWGKSIVLHISNSSDEKITVSCDDLSVNGYMVSEYFSCTVYPGKYAIDDITISNSDLNKNGITQIETFALKFKIYNSDTYETILKTDEMSFNVTR